MPDPRLTSGPADPRAPLYLASRRSVDMGEVVLKAARPTLARPSSAPTAAQVEGERSLWGPHPDPLHTFVEEGLYQFGLGYLRNLTRFVLGRKGVTIAKADPSPEAPGWGDIMRLFSAPGPAEERMATWESLVDGFTHSFLPGRSIENQAAVWALRSNLLHSIGERVRAVTTPGAWDGHFFALPPSGREALDWERAHGARFITNLTESARASILDTLVSNRLGGADHHILSRQLLEGMGRLNRDWRRIAITETAMAVASGQLATVADSLEWEAVWIAGPQACPACLRWHNRAFRVVPATHVPLDGETMVWPGKHNVGRSASLHTRDGRRREPFELWWPCIPAHPNCACAWALRRIFKTATGKKAAAHFAAIREAKMKAALA